MENIQIFQQNDNFAYEGIFDQKEVSSPAIFRVNHSRLEGDDKQLGKFIQTALISSIEITN